MLHVWCDHTSLLLACDDSKMNKNCHACLLNLNHTFFTCIISTEGSLDWFCFVLSNIQVSQRLTSALAQPLVWTFWELFEKFAPSFYHPCHPSAHRCHAHNAICGMVELVQSKLSSDAFCGSLNLFCFCRFIGGMQQTLTKPHYIQTVEDSMKMCEQRDEPTECQTVKGKKGRHEKWTSPWFW